MEIDGKPWFVAADVCRCLGLPGFASHHTKRLEHAERLVLSRTDNQRHAELFGYKQPTVSLISEGGLYKIITRSDKPEAAKFQDWITSEVLPAIRKDGAYVMGEEKVRTGELSDAGRHRGTPGASPPIPHSIGYIRSSHHRRQAHDRRTSRQRSTACDRLPSRCPILLHTHILTSSSSSAKASA